MKTLDEISKDFHAKTDKSSSFHNYTKLYPLYFEPLRPEKIKIFEIGIDKGYSLKAWKKYFEHADITGLDILDLKHFEEDRIHVMQADQKDCGALTKASEKYGPFDIIIDDGSHHNDDMKASFECLFPLLKPGGLYVVEDIHACYWPTGAGSKGRTFIDMLKGLIDHVHSSGKSDCANREQDTAPALASMNWWEKNVEFVHVYRSIVFIKKYAPVFDANAMALAKAGFIKSAMPDAGPTETFIMVKNITAPPSVKRQTPSITFRLKRKIKTLAKKYGRKK